MSARPKLWHLEISHYSEKIRWALDYKAVEHERRTPVPGYHMALALWLTRGRHYTLPILELGGERIGDSTAIIAALEDRYPDPPLYPAEPGDRRRALELEDTFDEELGPHIRRFVFHEVRRDHDAFVRAAAEATPGPMRHFPRLAAGYARAFTSLRFGAGSDSGAERARERVMVALDRLESELGSNEYLVGDRFTVADLTAAALFYPIVLPTEGPPQREGAPALAGFREALADRRGVRWVAEMFRRHRRRGASRPDRDRPVAAAAS
jgi:glutathione S-transferase